jgi:endo-1,4-beta-xylanase
VHDLSNHNPADARRRGIGRRRFLTSFAALSPFALRARQQARTAIDPSDEACLETAQLGIRQHRMSPALVRVLDAQGRPVHGASVRIEQLEHEFKFGANCYLWRQPARPDLEQAYRERFAQLFNSATLDCYWSSHEPHQGKPRHAQLESVARWCRQRSIACKGHPLAWANIPDPHWLPDDAVAIRDLSLGRVRDLVTRFRGLVESWDVVNEPSLLAWAHTRLGSWAQSIGTQSFVTQHLEAAREANPNACLLINEAYTAYPAYSLLDELRDQTGRPRYDAVGLQSHMHHGTWRLPQVIALCDRFAPLGVPLHFSEVTVLSGPRLDRNHWGPTSFEYEVMQGDYVPKLYTLLFSHPAVREITWWDLSDQGAWKGAPAGLLRPDMSTKPAYDRLAHLIHQTWRTQTTGETNPAGEFQPRIFHGQHRLTVHHRDHPPVSRPFRCAANPPATVEITLPAPPRQ